MKNKIKVRIRIEDPNRPAAVVQMLRSMILEKLAKG